MEAVILAGGQGTRLRSLVSNVPKPMAPINGVPFLQILLDILNKNLFSHVVISVGYLSQSIINHFGYQHRDLRISYSMEESPLGTGGAIKLALDRCESNEIFILNGDTFLELDYKLVTNLWENTKSPIIVGKEVCDTSRYGAMIVEKSRIIQFEDVQEKRPGVINAGTYYFSKEWLKEKLPQESRFSFETDFLLDSVRTYSYATHLAEGVFIDIGIPKDFNLAQSILKYYGQ
ncbi:MAG: dehydrogenase [Rhodospirillaceae bacterium]|nr:dehydrogenase [Rhodospirillaceae bacterium]|tara:strand:- start:4121 stop:4816 length:696 start_codon:yes stop_codon:yes gene_type:complete